jgi:hypothetical protein
MNNDIRSGERADLFFAKRRANFKGLLDNVVAFALANEAMLARRVCDQSEPQKAPYKTDQSCLGNKFIIV